jgi:diadenylate cyclase
MNEIYAWFAESLSTLLESFDPVRDTLDIAIVTCAVYWVLMLIKGTRAEQMMLGLLIVVLAWLVSVQLELPTVSFILDNFLSWGVLIVIVIFQRDIRRALTRVGLGVFAGNSGEGLQAIEEVVRACQALVQRRVGALLVMQREMELEEHMELGTRIDAELSRDLLLALFLPYSPLHDGAVIIREGRISAAGCILPLALGANVPHELGTRHRAALGIAEESDALAIVVSEETGRISLVRGGEIFPDLDGPQLRQLLIQLTGSAVREAPREAAAAPRIEPQPKTAPQPEREPVAVALGSETP